MAYLRRLISRYRAPLMGVCISVCAIGYVAYANLLETITTEETIHILPLSVTEDGWQNVEALYVQDVGEYDLLGAFTRRNSAYLSPDAFFVTPPDPSPQTEAPVDVIPTTDSDSGDSTITSDVPVDVPETEVPAPEPTPEPEPEPPAAPEPTEASEPTAIDLGAFAPVTTFISRFRAHLPFAQETFEETLPEGGMSVPPPMPAIPVEEPVTAPSAAPEPVESSGTPDLGSPDSSSAPEASTTTDDGVDITYDDPVEEISDEDGDVVSTTTAPLEPGGIPEAELPVGPSIIWNGFSLPALTERETIANAQIRLSMAAKREIDRPEGEPAPSVRIDYSMGNGVWQNAGTITVDDEVSNALNGGYYLFALPPILDPMELRSLEVRAVYLGNGDAVSELFIDSLWIELSSMRLDREALKARVAPDALLSLDKPEKHELISDTLDFTEGELPAFTLRYEEQRAFPVRLIRGMFAERVADVTNVTFTHSDIGEIAVPFDLNETNDGIWTIQLTDEARKDLQPGTYAVDITVKEGSVTFTDRFEFQWGLLALNTAQTRYMVGDTANISLAALSENGNTLCDARLELYAISEDDFIRRLPVNRSGLCNGNTVVPLPDYLSSYVVNATGTYELYVEHLAPDDTVLAHTAMTFEAVLDAPFTLARSGPTRIYPVAPYDMELTLTARDGFSGTLTERIPAGFVVATTTNGVASIDVAGGSIVWDVTLDQGATATLAYRFDAPDISPYLYELGPATFEYAVTDKRTMIVPNDISTTTGEQLLDLPTDVSTTVSSTSVVSSDGSEVGTTTDVTLQELSVDLATTTDAEVIANNEANETGIFTEHRAWQIASDATGSMLLYWASTTIPTGWTCVSCTGSDVFFQRFVVGSSTAGVNGGATTHTHTATATVATTGAGGVSSTGGGGADAAILLHGHTLTPNVVTTSNMPAYRNHVLIQNNSAGEPASIPAGAIALFDASVPSGWTVYSVLNGSFPRVDATSSINTTGGSSTIGHTLTGTTTASDANTNAPGAAGSSVAANTHTHTITASSTAASIEPPYREAIFGRMNATTTATDGMIAMWTDTPPQGWGTVSSSSEPFENRFVKASTTYGTTGGTSTHTHTLTTGIISTGSNTNVNRTTAGTGDATAAHTHTISVGGFSTVNHLPPYRTAIFAKRAGGGAPASPSQFLPFESEFTGTSTPRLEFLTTDPDGTDTLVYQVQWDDDYNLDDAPIGSSTSDNEAGCSPNCFQNLISGGDTNPFNENERIAFTIQNALTSGVTYYWRVRAKETFGNTWGNWSESWSFTYVAGTDPAEWFQTEDGQFVQGTLSNVATSSHSAILSVAQPSRTVVAYGEGTVTTPRYRTWNGTVWSAESSAADVGGIIQWIRLKANPVRDEYILGTQDASNDINFQVFASTSVWGNLIEATTTVGNNARRAFDVAYETTSGDAIAVYCGGSTNAQYRVWSGTAWTGPFNITTASAAQCQYVQMASDPNSDEIIAVFRDTGAQYEALVWDGAAWANSTTLGAMNETDNEGIAVQYEESGDQALVVVSNDVNNNFTWNAWTGTSWNGTAATVALGDDFEWGVLRRDVGSDSMALCYVDNDSDIGYMYWNGLSWQTPTTELNINGNLKTSRPVSCEFETNGSRDGYLLHMYSTTTRSVYQYSTTSTPVAFSNITNVGSSTVIGSVRASDGVIHAYFHNGGAGTYVVGDWTGSAWSTTTIETSHSVTAAPHREALGIAAQIYQPSSGSITTEAIDFDNVAGQTTWGEVTWNTTEPAGTDVLLQVMIGPGCTTTVPNGALSGNDVGFQATSSPLNISGLSTSTYNQICLKATLSSNNASNPTVDDWRVTWVREPVLAQTTYRWYANSNALTPTDAWPVGVTDLPESTPITETYASKLNEQLRLRMALQNANVSLNASDKAFTLEYATTTVSICDADREWYEVGAIGSTTAAWRGYNNAAVADGATLGTLLLTGTMTAATYEEQNDSALNPNSVAVGNSLEFDWVLENNAEPGVEYCFRMVESNGAPIDTYTVYPLLITNYEPDIVTLEKLFDNEKTATTTPYFEFSSADSEGDDITYQIQIDDDSAFGSVTVDRQSDVHTTQFSNLVTTADKDPFTSGERIEFRPTSAFTNGVTYYWRVRGMDPTGSNSWSEWSDVWSFTIDTSLTASAWFQTTDAQFGTNTLDDTESSGSNSTRLQVGFAVGTTTSDAIAFANGTAGNAWGSLTFTDIETSSDLKYFVEYFADDVWSLIPDGDLVGNSSGFDTSPVSLLGLDTDTYGTIRLVARLTDSGASPQLQDWTVNWGFKILPPDISKLFPNERMATTTPTFEFAAEDPQNDDLVYEIQWSTTYAFTASTTRTSSTSAGFANIDTGADTSPFFSGDTIQFTIQPADALTDNTTYWWRVRAVDPLGSNNFSAYTDPQSFTASSTTNVSTWYQTTQSQFDTDLLTGATSTVAGGVTVATSAVESLMAYAEGTVQTPRYRTWDGTTLSVEGTALTVGAPISWVVTKPGATREEYLLGTLGTDGDVNVQVYADGTWGNLQEITASVPNTTARGFDIAYETISGDALAVTCDGDADPTYWIWNGTSWTNTGSINLVSSNNCAWIKMASDPISDEIIMIARDSSGAAYELFVWNGSSWGNNVNLGSMNEAGHEGIALEYEESGNEAIAVTSSSTNAAMSYKTWNGSSWTATSSVALGDDFEAGSLAADVGSDNMIFCYVDEDNDIGIIRWTGAAWTGGSVELDTGWAGGNTVKNDRPVDCAFEVGGARDGFIMVVYSDTTNVRYRYWDGALWQPEADVSTIQDSSRVQVRRTGANLIQTIAYDITNNRYDYSAWNGTSWSLIQTVETSGVSGGYPYKEPFMIGVREPGSSGSLVGDPEIDFYDGSGPYWQQLSWVNTLPGSSTILYRVQYYDTASSSWKDIPNTFIPGNSSGTSTSPINLQNVLPVSTYSLLRPVATLTCVLTNCPTHNDWTLTWAPGINISGTAQQYNQSTNLATGTVHVALNGVLQSGKTGTISAGTWSIANVNAAQGDVLTVFIDNVGDTGEAVGVTTYDGIGDVSGMNLYQRHLSIGSDDATTTTNALIGLYDNTNDEDLFFDVSGGALTVCAAGESACQDGEIIIKSLNTYQPGSSASVTTHDFENNGTFAPNGNTIRVNGSWDNNGTTTMATSTVIFTATSTTETVDSTGAVSATWNNVTFGETSGTATWTASSTLDIDGNLSVNFGTFARGSQLLTIGGSLTTGASGFWTGIASTTFDGTTGANWSDANAVKQNVGYAVIDGSSKTVTLTGNVAAQTVTIGANDTLDANTPTSYDITVYGNWTNQNVWNPRSGEVIFAATTTGRTIALAGSSFYDLTFNGVGGAWAFASSTLSISNDLSFATGTVTLPTGTTTVAGSFVNTTGTFQHNNGEVLFTSTGAETITLGATAFTNGFYDLTFSGSGGTWNMTETSATTSNNVRIFAGTPTFPSTRLSIGGSFINSGGSFSGNGGELRFFGSTQKTVTAGGGTFASLRFDSTSTSTLTDTNVTALGSLTINSGTTTLPTGTLTLGGSLTNTARFVHSSGTVLFNSTDQGETITVGTSTFYDATFSSATGGWTISANATTTNALTISSAASFTLTSGRTLAVGGTFTNSANGASTTWTGSTLMLISSSTYQINASTTVGDRYDTLTIGSSTKVSMWNSSATTTNTTANGYLYSQDHATVDGDLSIYGAYTRTNGTEYWNVGRDFDGTVLATSSLRQVDVRFASGASAMLSSTTLSVVGTSTASTTVAAISGTYTVNVAGGTTTMQYYDFTNLGSTGLTLGTSTVVTSLADGRFVPAVASGSGLQVSSSTIDANPALQIQRVEFSTTTAISAINVTQFGGTPASYWWFRNSTGNLDGEAFDSDTGNPGSVRWDDSAYVITASGTVYADAGTTPLGGPTCDNVTPVVRVVVNGAASFTGPCDPSDGSYTISGVTFVGDPVITAYLDTNGGVRGTTVTRTPTGDITDLDIYANRIITKHEDTTPLSIENMAVYDEDNDTDVRFVAATGSPDSLTVRAETELFVFASTTFSPDGNVTLTPGGSGQSYDATFHIDNNATATASGTEAWSVGGRFQVDSGGVFVPASTTVTMTATSSGKTISSPGTINFNTLTFSGSGSWDLVANLAVANGVNLNAGTLSGSGNIDVAAGSISGNGTLALTGGTTTVQRTNTLGGTSPWQFYNLTMGNGSVVGTTTPAGTATTTVLNALTVSAAHTLSAGTSRWDLRGSSTPFAVSGTFDEGTSMVRYGGDAATTILSDTYYDLDINAASGSPTFTTSATGILIRNTLSIGGTATTTFSLNTADPLVTVTGNLFIRPNGTFIGSDSATLTARSGWDNDGTFTASGGTVEFTGATSSQIAAGSSSFATVVINGGGTHTFTENATATAAFTITQTGGFTVNSSTNLAVGGTFSNTVNGALTTWTGSTLSLYSGTSFDINPKSTDDQYGTLSVGANTDPRMWNSTASSIVVNGTGSLYSMDHANSTGALSIYGEYGRTSGTDYWSYAYDFDGTPLGGASRKVDVALINGTVANYTGGGLWLVGDSAASTTVTNQGSGSYTLTVGGSASTTMQYYEMRNMAASGVVFGGTPTVNTISNGDYIVSAPGGSAITVGGTAITQNPAKTFTNVRFATTTAISANNVTATGTTVSSWRFTNEVGNISGEAYDVDPGGDPGYIVWTDSAANITVSGTVYSDEGSATSTVCDGVTQNIRLVVAGVTSYDAACSATTAVYSIPNVSFSANDTLTVFINGMSPKAATVAVDPVSSISDMHLYENRVIVRHENTSPISIADIAAYDSTDDADVPFTAVDAGTDTLTLPANRKLIVWSGKTFTPSGNMTLSGGGGGASYDGTLELFANAVFTAAGTETHSVGGSMILGTNAVFTAAQSTFTMTTTGAGRTIDVNQNSFYNLVMNGAGSWTVTDTLMTVSNDMTVTTGAITLPNGTTTVGGSFANNGGSFTQATGTLALTATASGKTLRMGGSSVNRLVVNGSGGAWTMTDTNATTTLSVDVIAGTLTLPSGTFRVGSDFTASGTITHNSGTLRLTGTTTSGILRSGGNTLSNVTIAGTGSYTMMDSSLALAGTLTLQSGTTTFATNTLSIAGSLTASGGTFIHASGTVLMNSTDQGETVDPGTSRFYNLTFQNATGGWTVSTSATTTNNLTLSTAASFRQASSTTFEVNGVFTNLVGGSATNWDGSTLLLATSATYAINLKATTGDRYNILAIASSTDVSIWNSNATTTTTGVNGSLYAMDYGAADGELYVFGDYERSSGTDYWNYAIDFDGAVLVGGARRAVTVRHAPNATTTMRETATLNIVGDSAASTTVTNQGSGTYSVRALAGTFNASNYRMRNLGISGVELLGTTTVSSLSNGDWELVVASGTLITVASSTVNANASAVHSNVRFATTTAITGANVTLTGTTSAAWTFSAHSGNLAGESYDIDGGDACGSIRWSNSSCLLLQQAHYRWRNDDGGEAAPNSEWFDNSWTHRQRVVVTNADATQYTNAAVKVTVPYDGDMQTTFGDLRFTSSDGITPLSHWTEKYTASTDAVVWVEVPTLAASADTSVFMYYGNALASDGSNGTTTFVAFDDFEDDNITEYGGDTAMFNVGTALAYDRTYGLDAQGSENSQTTDGIYRTGVTVSQGETIRYFHYINTTTGSTDEACALFGVQSPGSNNNNYAICLPLFGTDRVTIAENVSSNETSGTVLSSSTITYATGWHEVEVDWQTNNTIFVSVYRNNVLVATTSASDASYSSGGIGFSYWFQHGAWDAVSSRPYITTDPTTRFGVEQTRNGASWLAALDTFGSSFVASTTARVRFGIENTGLAVTNKQFRLEYAEKGVSPSCESVGSGSYTAVPVVASCGSSPVCMAASANITDLASTTDQLGGTGQYTYGHAVENASNKTGSLNLGASTFTEVEYVIMPTINATAGTYCLRVTDNGAALDGYTRVAEMRLRYNPTVTNVVLNNGNDITVSPGATTTVSATATIMDLNGYTDMTQATATIYRSGVSGAGACTQDNNNCYRVASTSCLMFNCSGYSCTLSCSADIYYFADPTDIGTYAAETWSAFVSVVDSALGYGTGTSAINKELNTLRALDVTHNINYSSVESLQDTGAANATTTITNLGNDAIDISVAGTNLTSGSSTIPVNTQKFATTTFTYSACTQCSFLATSTTNLEVDLAKPTAPGAVADDVFWGISIPFGVAATAHQGQNTFYAIGD